MSSIDLSEKSWDNRYKNQDIGWDLGKISSPLKAYFNQLNNKDLKITLTILGFLINKYGLIFCCLQ